MKLTVKDISELINGKVDGEENFIVEGISTLQDATEKDITFFYNRKFLKQLLKTQARVIIVPEDIPSKIRLKLKQTIIKVKNPQEAFSKLLEIISEEKIILPKGIHTTAVVDETVTLGSDVAIGAYSVIGKNVTLGEKTIIYSQCYIGNNVSIGKQCRIYPCCVITDNIVIGNNVIIHPGTVIGADGFGYFRDSGIHKKIPQVGSVKIGDNVEIGANVCIDRATTGKTKIGSGTKIDNLVHIAHNVEIGKNCIILAQVGIAGSVKIGDNVTIAGQVGITDHVVIGDNAIIAARAGVIGDIKKGEIVSGYPARPHKQMLRAQALLYNLPKIITELRKSHHVTK